MNAVQLWCVLWNTADYNGRDTLFRLGCEAFGAPLMFAAVVALTDATTDHHRVATDAEVIEWLAAQDRTDIDTEGYAGGAF